VQKGWARVNGTNLSLILGTATFICGNSAVRKKLEQIYLDNHDVFESDFPLIRLWQPAEPPAGDRLSQIRAPVLIFFCGLRQPLRSRAASIMANGQHVHVHVS
jgi:hypothetical protein